MMRRVLITALIASVVACSRENAADTAAQTSDTGQAAAAWPAASTTLTAADIQKMKLIAGDWVGRGSAGTEQAPFYERYAWENDSTLVVYTFPDSSRATMTDTSTYDLRSGTFAKRGDGPGYAAERVDSTGAYFVPVRGAGNGFSWTPKSPNEWEAVIEVRRQSGANVKRTYAMTRMP